MIKAIINQLLKLDHYFNLDLSGPFRIFSPKRLSWIKKISVTNTEISADTCSSFGKYNRIGKLHLDRKVLRKRKNSIGTQRDYSLI